MSSPNKSSVSSEDFSNASISLWIITEDENLTSFLSNCAVEGGGADIYRFTSIAVAQENKEKDPDILIVEVSPDSDASLDNVREMTETYPDAMCIVLCDQERTALFRDMAIRGEIRDYFLIRPTLDRDYLQVQLWRALKEVRERTPRIQETSDLDAILEEVLEAVSEDFDTMFAGKRVLIVEDDFLSRITLRDTLALEGFQAETAQDVRSAAERLRSEEFDLILLDLFMPGVSGPPAVKAIRSQFIDKDMPIIVTSSCSDSDVVSACIKEGIKDYVVKPLRKETLLPRLKRVLNL